MKQNLISFLSGNSHPLLGFRSRDEEARRDVNAVLLTCYRRASPKSHYRYFVIYTC